MKNDLRNAGLYVILDRGYIQPGDLADAAKRIAAGGCKLIQYRDKVSSKDEVFKCGINIRKVLPSDVIFIINDYIDLVEPIGASGVHLGQEDRSIEDARNILGIKSIIGLSTHSRQQAMASLDRGVDYIGFGPIFATKTKPHVKPIGFQELKEVKKIIPYAVFGIGGIDENNLEKVLNAGASGVSMVSAILESEDIEAKIRSIIQKIDLFKKKANNFENKI